MQSRVLAVFVAIGLLGPAGASLAAPTKGAAAKAQKPPAQIVLDRCKNKKSPVSFNHEQHAVKQKIACKTCHHTGQTDKPCAASGCHLGKAEGKRPGCAEMIPSKNPFHLRCLGCHKQQNKGPRTCAQCHK